MNFLIAFIVILMFCNTVYSVNMIVTKGKVEYKGLIQNGDCLTNAACYSIGFIAGFFDLVASIMIAVLLV